MKIPIYSEKISDFLFFNEPFYHERYELGFIHPSVSDLLLSTMSGDAFVELKCVTMPLGGAAWYEHNHAANGAIFGHGFVEETNFDFFQLLSASVRELLPRIANELVDIRMHGGWTKFFDGTNGCLIFTIMQIIFEEFL